jgi:hypothetical protein
VAICRADEGDPAEIDAAVQAMRQRRPYVPVFVLAPGHDDRGLDEWAEWLHGQLRVRTGDGERPRGARVADI